VPAKIKVVDIENDPRWDEFVVEHPSASIYHHSSWIKVLASTYDYKPVGIALENVDTRKFEGLLPFFLIESKWTGRRLVSLPYTSYCEKLLPESQLSRFIDFASQLYPRLDYIELRFLEDAGLADDDLANANRDYSTQILALDRDLDQVLRAFHDTSVRHRIKRAEKAGLHFRITDDKRDLRRFYEMEIEVRQKHRLPPHPYRFFDSMWKILKPLGYFLLAVVEDKDKIIAAAIVLKFKNTFHLEYSASDQEALKSSPNQELIWEIIKMAHHNGARYFDFGRTAVADRPLLEFKERWGARSYPLAYCFFPSSKGPRREESFSRKLVYVLNRFLPATLLKLEGELLFPHLG
jgi:CelD/BcsL family acetyltransferase involved in cellulose biosynthesis